MLTSFTRDEKKILLFLLSLVGVSSVILMVADQASEVPILRGTPLVSRGQAPLEAGFAATSSSLAAAVASNGKIDLNAASAEVLRSIPGVGASLAEAIVTQRTQAGGFTSVEQLDDVPGVGPATLAKLRPHVFVAQAATPGLTQVAPSPAPTMYPGGAMGPGVQANAIAPPVAPSAPLAYAPAAQASAPSGRAASTRTNAAPQNTIVNLNTATEAELQTLHRVGPVLAQRILQYRSAHGAFRSVGDLDLVKGVGPKILQDNRHRLTVR